MSEVTTTTSTITGNDGFIFPGTGTAGYLRDASGIPHYTGPGQISHIPEFQRDFNLRDALITRIQEGRANMMRILFDWARLQGAYVTSDISPRWYLDYVPSARFYLKVQTNQGGTAGTAYAESTFILDSVEDTKRLQTGDLVAFMPLLVPTSRNAESVIVDYVESPASSGAYLKKELTATPLPEVMKVKEVNYTTGAVTFYRNMGGDLQTSTVNGKAVTVVANGTTDPGANSIRQEDAFFIKMTKPMREGNDDVTVWQRSNTWDFNHCQYVVRKWGVTDIQQNVYKRGQPENQYAKNRREALEQFFEELEYYALFGMRKEDYDAEGRWMGHTGGILEKVPSDHYVALESPVYSAFSSTPGDFTIPNFNNKLHNKFYYGSQNKIMLAGNDFHQAFATMLNFQTQNIPYITDRWSVPGYMFRPSAGGSMYVINSDMMTLNGMSHMAILFDPSTFQYGHLQNMDITVVDPLPSVNIHEMSGEVYGVFTFKHTNPDANWVFIMQPNT